MKKMIIVTQRKQAYVTKYHMLTLYSSIIFFYQHSENAGKYDNKIIHKGPYIILENKMPSFFNA